MNIAALKKQLIRQENLKLKPYTDTVGKITIGIGRNLSDNGISNDEAMIFLDNDIAKASKEANTVFPWFKNLNDVRQNVIINMLFNMGLSRLQTFVKMLKAVASGNYVVAAQEMLNSKWATQVGTRATELAHMMETGAE